MRTLPAALVLLAASAAAQPGGAVWYRPALEADAARLREVAADLREVGVTAVVLEGAGSGRRADLEDAVRDVGLEVVAGPLVSPVGLPLGAFASGALGGAAFAEAVRGAFAGADGRTPVLAPPRADAATTPEDRQRRRSVLLLHLALPGTPVLEGDLGLEGDSGLEDDSGLEADSLAAFVRRAVALRRSDAVLGRGDLEVVHAAGPVVAFSRTLGPDRRVVAVNVGDAPAFVPLGDGRAPAPLWPMAASRPDVDVPGLVALFDDDGAVYGLRVPPRAAVVYRPTLPDDVRPRGLDE